MSIFTAEIKPGLQAVLVDINVNVLAMGDIVL